MNNTNPKILVVEDETSIRKFICLNLKRNNWDTFEAESGEEALNIIDDINPDLVMLDVMLPGIDGFETCLRIRESHPDILIFMLTVKNTDMDKIMGLELGADDYMVKPFNPLELIARVKAMLRRSRALNTNIEHNITTSGRFKLDKDSRQLYKDGLSIILTPREFAIMEVFFNNPNKALTRDELLNAAWGQDFIGDYKTVDVHISRLREKIEDDPADPQFIQTVWGCGYRYSEVK